MSEQSNTDELYFQQCDFSNSTHCSELARLVDELIKDPMGGGVPHSKMQQLRLVDGLANHPSCLILFACTGECVAGLAIGFINFSTKHLRPYLNIHNIIISSEHREKGVGKALLEKCISISQEKKYCKITLEVRRDNLAAQYLFKTMGLSETEPELRLWRRMLV